MIATGTQLVPGSLERDRELEVPNGKYLVYCGERSLVWKCNLAVNWFS